MTFTESNANQVDQESLKYRKATQSDLDGILRLSKTMYPDDPSLEHIKWKYELCKRDFMGFVAETRGTILGYYGCLHRRLLFQGIQHSCVVPVDVMVAPYVRNGFLFIRLLNAFQRHYQTTPYLFMYGFPNPRHQRFGFLRKTYTELDLIHELKASISSMALHLKKPIRLKASACDKIPREVDLLWSRIATTPRYFGLIRDFQYLKHRYQDHPNQKYGFISVVETTSQHLAAFFVVTFRDKTCQVIDLLAPFNQPEVIKSITAALLTYLKSLSFELIEIWVNRRSLLAQTLRKIGFQEKNLNRSVVYGRFSHDWPFEQEIFFYTMGDLDTY